MEKKPFEVTGEFRGARLDKFLAMKMPNTSRSYIQKLVSAGLVLVNGSPSKAHRRMAPGDVAEVAVPERRAVKAVPEDIPLNVVYEDEDVVVIDKAAGMVVHPAPGNYSGTLVNALLWRCPKLSGLGGDFRPGIVHRLDKGTSGLIVAVKNDGAYRALVRQFRTRSITRKYLAIVKGSVRFDQGLIELPIGRSLRDRKKMSVTSANPKVAVTRYHVERRLGDTTLVSLKLETGRTHQIRVHLASMGHPIIGDDKYGSAAGLGRVALHAQTLGFVHPASGEYMEFKSELPEDMLRFIESGSGDRG